MTVRIGAQGQVVIPKAIRDEAKLHPGDEVDVVIETGDAELLELDDPPCQLEDLRGT